MAEPLVAGEPAKHRRLEMLDVLRFLAALMVVCFHWFFNGIDNGKVADVGFTWIAPIAVYGFFGVHLFFIISGFVISQSALGKTAGQFVVSRGVRLFPAYWVAMIVTTVVVNIWGNDALQVTFSQFLANLTMLPGLFGEAPIDGVYWTLTIELTFYLLILLLLLLGMSRILDMVFPAWAIGMVAVRLFAPGLLEYPYTGSYFPFFAAGAIIATIQRRGFSLYQVVGLLAAMASAFVFVLRDIAPFNSVHAIELNPVVVVLLVTLLFAAVAASWIPRLASLRIPLSRPISDLTYPIYLLHAHIGYTVLSATTDWSLWIVYPAMFAGLIGSAWLLHWGVEVKLKATWFALFGLLRRPFDRLAIVTSWPFQRLARFRV